MESLSYTALPVQKFAKKLQKQRVVESILPAEAIDKPLSVSAEGEIGTLESVQGRLDFSGTVRFSVLFLNTDGEIVAAEQNADFADSLADGVITASSKYYAAGDVSECTVERNGDGEVKVRCTFELTVLVLSPEELRTLDPAPGVFVKQEDRSVQLAEATVAESFRIEEEKPISCIVTDIVSSDASAAITDAEYEDGKVLLEGTLCVNVNYRKEEEYDSVTLLIPFREETAYAGEGAFRVLPRLAVGELNVVAAVDEEKKETTLNVNAELRVSVDMIREDDVQLTTDAFVKDYKSNVQMTGLNTLMLCDRRCCRTGVDGRVECPTEADVVLAVADPKVHIVNADVAGGVFTAEAVLTACIVYADETGAKGSFEVEVPFQTDSESVDSRAVEAFCSGIACDVHVRLRMRGELEISFKATVVTDLFAEQTLCSVSDLELVGACETGALISVYVPGEGDTVFEVARELNADPESIDADTFLQGEKVVVFRGAN